MTTTPHIFQVPERLPQSFQPHRRGSRWTTEDDVLLCRMVSEGNSIAQMCIALGRDIGGITGRFENLGIARLNDDGFYVQTNTYNTLTSITTTEENIMSTPNTAVTIETKTFILGRDASTMTDVEIFNLMAKTEAELCRLKGIQTKSTKLAAHIARVEYDLCHLAEYLDKRA